MPAKQSQPRDVHGVSHQWSGSTFNMGDMHRRTFPKANHPCAIINNNNNSRSGPSTQALVASSPYCCELRSAVNSSSMHSSATGAQCAEREAKGRREIYITPRDVVLPGTLYLVYKGSAWVKLRTGAGIRRHHYVLQMTAPAHFSILLVSYLMPTQKHVNQCNAKCCRKKAVMWWKLSF